MKIFQLSVVSVAILTLLLAAPAMAGQGYEKVKGEVVAVEQQTQNQGVDQLVTVRTRNGEQRQFRLGDNGSCGDCVQVGDRIQARVGRGAGQQPGRVQSMKVKRNQEMYGYAYQSGQLVRTQQRLRDGSGAGQQTGAGRGNGGNGPGTGICDGSGRGAGGSRSGGGNGGGRGPGGGGN